MSRSAFPPKKGMKPYWRRETQELDNHRSTSDLPTEADIVIIGAGYSSAALLSHILSMYADEIPSILILEARELCSGATGRNGGHLKPDSYYTAARVAREYGMEAAAELANFESANVDALIDYIRNEQVNCDLVVTRALDVQLSAEHQERVKAGYDALIAGGVEATKRTYCAPVEYAETISGVKGAQGLFSYTAGHLWPYKLIQHMFKKAIERGVNLQTNTPVQRVSPVRDEDGFWTITTERQVIKTKKIVMATNAYTAALLPEYAGKIVPYRAICSRITTPGKPPLLNSSYALRFNDWDFDYLIPRPDGSIIVGGARKTYIPHLEDWYGNTNDTELIERAQSYFDGYMQRHFHGWESSGARVDDVWTGIMGYSSDRLPRVGPIPNRSGMYIMGGFTGHGMPQVFLCGRGMADMIMGDKSFEETELPRIFKETEERLKDPRNGILDMYKIPLGAFGSKL